MCIQQQQQTDVAQYVPQLVQQVIGVVLLVVLVAWGLRQVKQVIKGEPVEQLPF